MRLPTPIINEKIVEKLLAEYRVADLVDQGQQSDQNDWRAASENLRGGAERGSRCRHRGRCTRRSFCGACPVATGSESCGSR